MRTLLIVFAVVIGFASSTYAIPYLQLDIGGGTYDTVSETVVTSSSSFNLYAFAKTGAADVYDEDGNLVETKNFDATTTLDDTFYLSVAVPDFDPGDSLGSFTFNGDTISFADMAYGTPPEGATNPLLGKHGIFDTYYFEYDFQFDGGSTTAYNTQDNPGAALFDPAGDEMLYMAFDVNISGLNSEYGLHFDLYNQEYKENKDANVRGDFAPFSHDAGTVPVPEPSTLVLLGAGLVGLAVYRRRKK